MVPYRRPASIRIKAPENSGVKVWALISIVRFQSDIFSQSQAWKVGRLWYRHILVYPFKVDILWEDHDAWYSYCRLVAEDRTPVALFEVNMKAIFIFLFVSILGLLAVKRSAAGKFIHFPVLLKRSASVVYAQYVFLHGCVVSCKEFFKSRFKSGSHEPYIWLINILK